MKIKIFKHLLKFDHWFLVTISTGLFLRIYKPLGLFQYSHDQDLAGWFIRDVLINHHLRLIGQETSSHGIFIGPFFYYLQIPFYMLSGLDPSGAIYLPIILGVFAIWSVYFTFSKMFTKRVALIGAIFHACSILIVFTEREIVPTQPVMLWTIWFLYSIWLVLKGKKNAYILIAFLIGLIWNINLQLVILLPLVFLAQILSRKTIPYKKIIIAVLIALILNFPFLAFEFRHEFGMTKSLVSSLTTSKDYIAGTRTGFIPKLDRTMQLAYKNSTDLFGANLLNLDNKLIFWSLFLLLLYVICKRKIQPQFGILLIIWLITYILFFTKISLNISEYYLNGMNIVYILIASLSLSLLLKNKKIRVPAYFLIILFISVNLYLFFARKVNENGYLERKAVISYIKEDANKNNYPCVSLSFITSPGNNLGYRYFTWELGLKTKPVSKDVPVYSIVFPLSLVDRFDKSFGALGVVNPDYKRYNQVSVKKACQGEDFTINEPMFGFTN